MEETPTYIDYSDVLDQIQINSYNLDQQFKHLNEQLLADTTTSTAITINQGITKINHNLNILTIMFMIYLVFTIVKIRGEKR